MTHIGGLHITQTGSVILTAKEVKEVEDHIDQLEAENAKLRELASRMRDHIKSSCVECDELYCSSWDEDNGCCVYDTLAREAGIKVGDA